MALVYRSNPPGNSWVEWHSTARQTDAEAPFGCTLLSDPALCLCAVTAHDSALVAKECARARGYLWPPCGCWRACGQSVVSGMVSHLPCFERLQAPLAASGKLSPAQAEEGPAGGGLPQLPAAVSDAGGMRQRGLPPGTSCLGLMSHPQAACLCRSPWCGCLRWGPRGLPVHTCIGPQRLPGAPGVKAAAVRQCLLGFGRRTHLCVCVSVQGGGGVLMVVCAGCGGHGLNGRVLRPALACAMACAGVAEMQPPSPGSAA